MNMQHEVPGLFARYEQQVKERIADFNDPHQEWRPARTIDKADAA